MRPVASKRRHPLCAECGYDLVGTVEADRRTCPECGVEFELADLVHERLPGDWTPWRGLRRAALRLGLKSAVCVPVLVGLMVLVSFVFSSPPFVPAFLVFAVAGVALGVVLGHRLFEHAGFVSAWVTGLGIALAWGVAGAAVAIGALIRPLPGWPAAASLFIAGGFATVSMVRQAFLEE